jgi:hypothetical protein
MEGELFSARGKCPEDGNGRMLQNAHELRTMSGEAVLRWRRGVAAGVGARLLDEKREQG